MEKSSRNELSSQQTEAMMNNNNSLNKPPHKYKIICQTYLNKEIRIKLFNYNELALLNLVIADILERDDILTNLDANDLRMLFSIYADYLNCQESEAIRKVRDN